ncbi:MAG: hypothetical protein M0R32_08390 [Candidatus Cloacimonetes bacterium]|jgi:hypothetical protein|nr:hypothetical protein [Candidatus Cloacimonadota bacterium]
MKIGDPVEVLDPGLKMLREMMASMSKKPVKPNHYGTVQDIDEQGNIIVEFPIGNDNPEEHSQVAPYPPNMVRLRKVK